jgi:hypothetical protein
MLTSFLPSGEIQQIQLGFCSLKRELRNWELQKRLEEQMSTTHVVTTLSLTAGISAARRRGQRSTQRQRWPPKLVWFFTLPAYVPTPLPTLLVGTCRTYYSLWGSFAFASQSFFVAAHCPGLNCISLVSNLLSFMLSIKTASISLILIIWFAYGVHSHLMLSQY